jgi:VWFA-related protein
MISPRVLLVGLCLCASPFPISNSIAKDTELLQRPVSKESSSKIEFIQIAVMDKKGNPVTNLQMKDFALYDNGRPRDLTVIENHNINVLNNEQQNSQTPNKSINTLLPRRIFFLFDFAFTDELGFLLARDSALRFIKYNLLSTDEIGVISFSGRKNFRLYEFQTKDRFKIAATIESFSLQDLNPVIPLNDDENLVGRKIIITDRAIKAEVRESNEEIMARNFVWAMASFAQGLRYLPGLKNIILYSSGIPNKINKKSERSKNSLNIDYPQLYKEMATSNIAVYSSYTGSQNEKAKSNKEIFALREMATVTGGQYYSNVRDSEEYLNNIQTLTGTYYVLGYRDEMKRDEDFHKIKVNVNRAGCVVRILSGYFDPKPFDKYSKMERQLHLMDIALAEKPLSQTPVPFKMRAFVRSHMPPNNLGFVAEIPLDELEDIIKAGVEVISLVFNGADDIVDFHYVESDFTIYKNKKAFLFVLLSVPFGDYDCRIVLRNHSTGRAAVASVSAHVPKPKADDLVLYPPIFYLPAKDALNLSDESIGSAKATKGNTKIAEMFFFNPAQFIPYFEKLFKRHTDIWATVHCYCNKGDIKGLRLSAFLVDRNNGNEIPVSLIVVDKNQEGEKKIFFIKLKIPDVEPDTYAFNILATNMANMHSSRIGTSIIIE